ncbi:PQQ-dependent sugar dehydrogenase [Fontivita pretiosa]|uniref:PQQ-dependent sugar dehydrogenase n=1 Tax=Fontivita pretiosa TaxID=2989684 RepID=UPI003D17E94E
MIPARRALAVATVIGASTIWITPADTLADVPLRATRIVAGLSDPIYVAQAPGDNDRLFIVQQGFNGSASIYIYRYSTGTLNATSFLTVSGLATGGEQGLLGLAFHPNYASNGQFYLNYTAVGGQWGAGVTRIVRYTRSSADMADPASAQPVLSFDQPQANHNGGWMGFGPNDGYLYINTGDGGGGNDDDIGHTPGIGNAQDTSNLLGKVLRVDVNADDFPTDPQRNYRIPPTNPFVNQPGADEIWSYGLRNPWRASFDRGTGDFYIGDVGQGAREEINFQPATSSGGENYGWRAMEGELVTGLTPVPPSPPRVDPIHTYVNPNEGRAVTGGYVYRGSENDALAGTYFFADYAYGRIWSFRYDPQTGQKLNFRHLTGTIPTDAGSIGLISSFGEDNLGRLYIVDLGGEIFRLIPAMPGDANLDDVVNIRDLYLLASNWQTSSAATWRMGDFTDDGRIDMLDLNVLASRWQDIPGSSSLSEALAQLGLPQVTVPEPAALSAVLLILLPSMRSRRRR